MNKQIGWPAVYLGTGLAALVSVAVGLTAGCATVSSNPYGPEVASDARAGGPRPAFLRQWRRGLAELAVGQGATSGLRLAAVWPLTRALHTDSVARQWLRDLTLEAVPPALVSAWWLEVAAEALGEGRGGDAGTALRRAAESIESTSGGGSEEVAARASGGAAEEGAATGRRGVADARTTTRLAYGEALLALTADPAAGRPMLVRVANRPHQGAEMRRLSDRARLTAAASYLGAGDYRQAIAHYLRIDSSSGLWREARLGLAICQLAAGRPEAALKILVLLPVGVAAEPERAVVAAMAAHTLGYVEEARLIVDTALESAPHWQPDSITVGAVLGMLSEPSRRDALLESPLAVAIVDPRVRPLADELLATRKGRATASVSGRADLMAYEAALEVALADQLSQTRGAQALKLDRALRDLRTLRPQLQ